jgi:alkylation response protein AidB-like acyl-CoA dehydrogenase
LSLFLVPKYIRPFLTLEEAFAKGRVFDSSLELNDITIKRVHNIGPSSCTYVDLEFGVKSTLGALAFLIGKENEGIHGIRRHLLSNNLQIGYSAVSTAISAFQHSLSYATNPQPMDSLKDMSYSHHQEVIKETPMYPDDGHAYFSFRASLPHLEQLEQQRVEDFLNQQREEGEGEEGEGEEGRPLIADGKQVRRPLLARPDIKGLLLQQKVYTEGALALCVYSTHLLDILENDSNQEFVSEEILYLFELLSPIAKYYSTHFSLKSIRCAKEIYDGVGVIEGNLANDMLR